MKPTEEEMARIIARSLARDDSEMETFVFALGVLAGFGCIDIEQTYRSIPPGPRSC